MNWTGGRLRRHSNNNPSTLARIQKQKFAKSKSNNGKVPRQLSLFQTFPQFGVLEQENHKLEETCSDNFFKNSRNIPLESQTPRDLPTLPNNVEASNSSKHLAHIKRQLLEKTDWAAVAAARPLKMSFTSTEEAKRFGKRRKLTEDDHRRLVSENRVKPSKFTMFRKKRENGSSDKGTIEGLDIRINGQRPGAGQRSICDDRNNVSSQSMLLDREEPECPAQRSEALVAFHGRHYTEARRTSSSTRLQSPHHGSTISTISNESRSRLANLRTRYPILRSTSADINLEGIIAPQELARQYLEEENQESLQSDSYHSIRRPPESSIRRRFTLDDQFIAEKEGRFNATFMAPIEYQSPKLDEGFFDNSMEHWRPSEKEINTTTDTQSSSGWLPAPRTNIRRVVDQKHSDMNFIPFSTPSKVQRHGSSARLKESKGQYISPIKIFGQSIVLNNTKSLRDSPYWISTPWKSGTQELNPRSETEGNTISSFQFAAQVTTKTGSELCDYPQSRRAGVIDNNEADTGYSALYRSFGFQ